MYLSTGRPYPLGARLWDDGINVAVYAEATEGIDLCLIDHDGHEHRLILPGRTGSIFHGHIGGIHKGWRYGFRTHANPDQLLLDPWALSITDGVGVIIDEAFDWGSATKPAIRAQDLIIYEAHVKGMTKLHPEVPEEHRGTYLGMTHSGVINHLKELGVNAIEFLPIHEHRDEEHLIPKGLTNYWGYNTLGFFAPHSGYASTPGDQVNEFKNMVKVLHENGIAVILDVVFNHTAEAGEDGPLLSLRGLAPHEYYLPFDTTGCGLTVNATSAAGVRLIMESLRYWVQHMHVDGFRFDLATALSRNVHTVDMKSALLAAIEQDPVLQQTILIAEPWDIGPDGYQLGGFPSTWREWNDRYRDCVRDFWRGTSNGIQELGWRLTGSQDIFGGTKRPATCSVNFIAAHDGFTLHDVTSYSQKHNEANLEDNRDGHNHNISDNYGVEGPTSDANILRIRRRQMRNLLGTLLLSTGTPMILAGDEFGRTQLGNNNAYCQDNEISWLNWDLEPWQRLFLDFTRRMIALRKSNSTLRREMYFTGAGTPEDLAWLDLDGTGFTDSHWQNTTQRCFAMYLDGDESNQALLVLFNGSDEQQKFTLPGAPYGTTWARIMDTAEESPVEGLWLDHAGESIAVVAKSMVLFQRHDH